LGIKGLIQNEKGDMIYNATIKVYQLINNNWQYIDHDVISSEKGYVLDIGSFVFDMNRFGR
jgi:hypothetical protein